MDLLREDPDLKGRIEMGGSVDLDALISQSNSPSLRKKVSQMLQKECLPNLPTIKCETVLDAVRYDDRKKLQQLLEAGDDPNCGDDDNCSPLHLAALCGGALATEILLEAGADVHASDSNGDTPLHVAARRGWFIIAQQLLLAGADGAVRNKNGQTPAAVARKHLLSSVSQDEGFLTLLDQLADS